MIDTISTSTFDFYANAIQRAEWAHLLFLLGMLFLLTGLALIFMTQNTFELLGKYFRDKHILSIRFSHMSV